MSKMGAYVLELQTKQDEENAHVPACKESSSRHRNKSGVVTHLGGRGGIREWRTRTSDNTRLVIQSVVGD